MSTTAVGELYEYSPSLFHVWAKVECHLRGRSFTILPGESRELVPDTSNTLLLHEYTVTAIEGRPKGGKSRHERCGFKLTRDGGAAGGATASRGDDGAAAGVMTVPRSGGGSGVDGSGSGDESGSHASGGRRRQRRQSSSVAEEDGPKDGERVLVASTPEDAQRWVRKLQRAIDEARAIKQADLSGMHPALAVVSVSPPPESDWLDDVEPAKLYEPVKAWSVIGGPDAVDPSSFVGHDYNPVEENPERLLAWYRLHFLPAEHANFIADLGDSVGVVVVSLLRTQASGKCAAIRVIIWTRAETRPFLLLADEPFRSYKRDLRYVLATYDDELMYKKRGKFKCVTGRRAVQALLDLEAAHFARTNKIGLIYARHGQTNEADILQNDLDYPNGADRAFEEFCNMLGTRVELKGWDGFRAGLDTADGGTGLESVFTSVHSKDVMFHVSTFLPHDREDSGQAVQRKRHIGNDISAIVFMDGTTPFAPDTIKCQFLHVFAVVQPDPKHPHTYRCQFAHQSVMRTFGQLPITDMYLGSPAFVHALITNMINGIRSAISSAPDFALKARRTDQILLDSLFESFKKKEAGFERGPSSGAPASTERTRPVAPTGSGISGPRREAIAPTAPERDGLTVFEFAPLVTGLGTHVHAWDHWETKYVYSDASGVNLADASGADPVSITRQPAAQIRVIDSLRIAVIRFTNPRTKISYIHLDSIGVWVIHSVRSTKRAVDFTLDVPTDRPVQLAVARKSSIELFEWRYESFVQTASVAVNSPPVWLQYLSTGRLAVVEDHTFVTLDPSTGESTVLNHVDHTVRSGAMLEVSISGKASHLVMCENMDGILAALPDGKVTLPRVNFPWTFLPHSFAVIDYFVFGFAPTHIEVRNARNGALVQVMELDPPIRILSIKNGLFVGSGVGAASAIHHIIPTEIPIAVPAVPASVPELDASSLSPHPLKSRTSHWSKVRENLLSSRFHEAKSTGERRPSVLALKLNRTLDMAMELFSQAMDESVILETSAPEVSSSDQGGLQRGGLSVPVVTVTERRRRRRRRETADSPTSTPRKKLFTVLSNTPALSESRRDIIRVRSNVGDTLGDSDAGPSNAAALHDSNSSSGSSSDSSDSSSYGSSSSSSSDDASESSSSGRARGRAATLAMTRQASQVAFWAEDGASSHLSLASTTDALDDSSSNGSGADSDDTYSYSTD